MNPTAQRVLTWLIILLMPFFLLTSAVQLVFNPRMVPLAYAVPGFPEDMYGFTTEERVHWAGISLDYLMNDAGIEFLSEQRLPDGSPLYNERELSHMVDVKVWFQNLRGLWLGLFLVLAGLGLAAWRGGLLRGYFTALGRGGQLTILLILSILVLVAISFRALFTLFHRLFFEGDTWLFNYSDTLIRLFPMTLWQNAFIAVGVVTLLGAGVLIWVGRKA